MHSRDIVLTSLCRTKRHHRAHAESLTLTDFVEILYWIKMQYPVSCINDNYVKYLAIIMLSFLPINFSISIILSLKDQRISSINSLETVKLDIGPKQQIKRHFKRVYLSKSSVRSLVVFIVYIFVCFVNAFQSKINSKNQFEK